MKIKQAILNKIIKHLFKGFTDKDIISYNKSKGEFSVEGNILGDSDIDNIMSGLTMLESNDGYEALLRDVEHRAEEILFFKSKTEDDMMFAKSALFVVDIIRKRRTQLLDEYENYNKWKLTK